EKNKEEPSGRLPANRKERENRCPCSIKDGLYELRIEWQGNIYRIFFCYDEGRIVILFNGFQKKTQKTPDREINKALKLKKEYYERKRTEDV
ncbi:type II toxin-antitoxin system RelE/ParE family toxin, partial [Bacteroides finegoldii]|uniref:type II toxin-antitoxin system RelE/ParE family toxin n=1 Tax=Bacteroides finegoldii TaxID=338188 RepID=UPI0032ED8933